MKEHIANLLSKQVKLSKEEIEKLIEVPKNSEQGDFAFPCFVLAKEIKKSPVEIAKELVNKIKTGKEFEKIESKGPYVNFFLNKNLLAQETLSKIIKEKDKYGSKNIKEKVIIEFPSPNTNKPLHIGHARNIILGQSISKILEFLGNKVIISNLNNDRGIHICKSMLAYDKYGKGTTPEKSGKKSDHFIGDYYVKFAQEAKNNPNLEEGAQEYLRKWEQGDKKIVYLWKKMNSWAFKGFNETYKRFDLKINKNYYESKIYMEGKDIVLSGLNKGVFNKKEDGAIFVDLSNKGLGEKILLRADGTSIYITQDIYLASLKHKEFSFDKSIYVSASEQNNHFRTLFSILKLLGYKWADKLYHLSYGMVNLESGRMKSREGNVVDSDDLIDELEELAREEIRKRERISKEEIKQRTKVIAMSALRYYFLKVDRNKDIVFKPEESIIFEGNTGPYLLYSYARAKSILKKAKSKGKLEIKDLSNVEKILLSKLSNFPEIVIHSYNQLSPNLIANYAYELSQIFNEFYHSSQVIGSEQEKFRLSLVEGFSQVLKNALYLLGIPVIEKM